MNGQPHLHTNQDTNGWASTTIKQNAVDDAVSILLSQTLVAKDVAHALEHLHLNVGILVSSISVCSIYKHFSYFCAHFCLKGKTHEWILYKKKEINFSVKAIQVIQVPIRELL